MNELRSELAANFRCVDSLAAVAEILKGRKALEQAAAYAQLSAQCATANHPGLFVSLRLEETLQSIGRELFAAEDSPSCPASAPEEIRNVLHVLTQGYNIGGHTRLAWRWIQRHAGCRHSVAITQQDRADVPARLMEAVVSSGGEVHVLVEQDQSLLGRARLLRRLACQADLVVLHIHPFDVIPLVAFSAPYGGPPRLFMNHSDHTFWLGVGITDLLIDGRSAGIKLSHQRRGFPEERCGFLPIPLDPPQRTCSRSEAKRRLGVDEDCAVLVSMAQAFKYTPVGELDFLEVLGPVIESRERALLLVLGPSPTGRWAEASKSSAGRILAVGSREDPEPFLQAADIYVDSIPFGSMTSALEATSYGTPLLSLVMDCGEPGVLAVNDPALPDELFRAATVDEYRERLTRLLEDGAYRANLGARLAESISAVHAGEAWQRSLHEVYAQAVRKPEMLPPFPTSLPQFTRLDLLLHAINKGSGRAGLEGYARYLP